MDKPSPKRPHQTTARLSDTGNAILVDLSARYGVNFTGIIEMALRALREKAERDGVRVVEKKED